MPGFILGSKCVCINYARKGDLVLQILSYVAQTEREFIKQRQAEGIAAAKNRGVVFGRPCIKRPDDYDRILSKWRSHEMTVREAAALLGVSHATFLKWSKESTTKKVHLNYHAFIAISS